MHLIRKILITLLILIFTGCAVTQIKDYSKRIEGAGYSVLPPKEEGWIIHNKSYGRLVLGKKGKNIDETYAALIILFRLPDLSNDEAFYDFVERSQKQNRPSERYKVLSLSSEPKNIRKWVSISLRGIWYWQSPCKINL